MKRTVAFLAAVFVFTGIILATSASAQDTPPPPPTDASGDTLGVGGESPAPQGAAQAPDTTAAASARARRMRAADNRRSYFISLGIGSGIEYKPDDIVDNYSPAFGGMLAVGARQYGVTAAAHFGYNFFLAEGTIPNDLNILTIFADLRYAPTRTKARPYLVVCGGYWRQWVVDLDYTENVLGYGGGAGIEIEIDRVKRLFFDVRYIQGQTRKTAEQANTEIIPMRLGITWEFR
jgi:hypothetical protein